MKDSKTARYVLGLLLAVNLVNFLDRYVLASLLPLIQADLKLTDTQAGGLASAFMVVYMVAALPIGYWADKGARKGWISGGIAFWSLATAASGMASGYGSLFAARSAVGIGEACFGTTSPSFVAEHFSAGRRGSVMAVFSMAAPVGSALGFILGGAIGQRWGWRAAFFMVGIPGLLLAVLTSRLTEPRGRAEPSRHSPLSSYLGLFAVPSFRLSTLAGAALNFALGGFAVWMPSFFVRQWGMSVARAGVVFGGITVVSGVAGSMAGGWLSDRVMRVTRRSYFLVSGLGLLIGMPLAIYSVVAHDLKQALVSLFIAEFFLFFNMGPFNTIIVGVTDLKSRSMAFAANIFCIHALGDAVSPSLIGAVSDRLGLRTALIGTCLSLGLAGIFCLLGMRHYEADSARIGDDHA